MIIDVSKFGEILISRPAGKETFLMSKAYIFNSYKPGEAISLDFLNVKVLTPSWADEFISGIKKIIIKILLLLIHKMNLLQLL